MKIKFLKLKKITVLVVFVECKSTLKIIKLFDDVNLPIRASKYSSGYDLFAHNFKKRYRIIDGIETEDSYNIVGCKYVSLMPMDRVLIGTGIKATYGEGYEIQIRSRSGLTLKNGLIVANGIGTIDSDFSGELGVILINVSRLIQVIELGTRIAQMVVAPVELPELEIVKEFDFSNRGESGYGSSGIK